MKKRILILAVALLITILLSGCDMVTFNVSELMTPPKATGEQADIQKLIEKEAGSGYTLKYPQNGTYRSSITTMDYDNDSVEEAVAFYIPAGEGQSIHLLVMDQKNGKWTTVGNFEGKSSIVDRLVFCDLDGDNKKEIAVGWSSFNPLVSDLSVYLVNETESIEITSENKYTDFLCGRFTGTDKEELLLLSLYTPDKPASASLISLNDTKNSLYSLGDTPIDATITSFRKIQCGNVFEGQFGAVVDGESKNGNESVYSTQIIYYSSYFESLEKVSFSGEEITNQAYRSYAVMSEDIDGDSIIEIPNTFKMNIDDAQTDAVPAALIHWCEYTNLGTMKVEKLQATSLVLGCRFTIPDNWQNNYTAYVNYSTNEITFYEWKDNKTGDPLLVIKVFPTDIWNDETSAKGYTELGRNDSSVYGFITFETNSSILPTNEEIIKAFSLA
ncbi:MAG: hypothetical protein IKB72_03400 [Ruminococcus sp.]|nr:hypothetical protein [Oscillospiraceae bacterium]MBR2724463.1 hypothetical protein [Ruminococcus sp.]